MTGGASAQLHQQGNPSVAAHGKAERGVERQKERAWLLVVKEISRTNLPDNPQGFTRKRL